MESDRRSAAELVAKFKPAGAGRGWHDAIDAFLRAGVVRRWRRDGSCAAAVASGGIACVLKGAVRKYWVRHCGQRQIVDLLMPGDFLGLGPLHPHFVTEAVAPDTRMMCWTFESWQRLAREHDSVAEFINGRSAVAIARLEAHLLIQGRMTATEKVGGYLAAMASRLGGSEEDRITLPVSRCDIADHLGIAVETVSRTISTLARCGSIKLSSPRQIEITDAALLEENASLLPEDRTALQQAPRALPA